MELTAPSNNDKLGDFRGYNHSANTPTTPSDFDRNWGPGGATISLTFVTYVEEWNLRETTSGSTPYISVRYYLSSSNRNSKTSAVRTYTVLASETSNTPPTGHTNNQTQRPASASQVVTDSSFPTSLITKPDDVLYVDIYISDISGNEVARFGAAQSDGHVDVDTHEYANPFVDACGPNWTPQPSGYTFVAVVVTSGSGVKNGVDFVESNGSTSYGTFYWYVYGLKSGTYYRIGSSTVTAVLRIPGGTDTTILSGALNSAGASSNESASGTLSASQQWAWDDEADVVLTAANWSTITEYSLGATQPTCT
ncbi:MAG: hypothetical protein ACYTBJ_20700 [Planctomycetota bacterium]|jgi:hypothetical protein